MKKGIQLFGVLIASVIFISCLSEKKGNYLDPVTIEIPEILNNNIEAVSFIEQSSQSLNQWSIILEDLVVECGPYMGKEEAELSVTDKIILGKVMMDFVANLGQFAVSVSEFEQNATTLEYNLNDQELEAMILVMAQFEKRIEEINKMYQDFGKEDM